MPLIAKPKPKVLETLEPVRTMRELLHELNNALTGELISAGLLRSLVPLTPPSKRYASEIEESAERAARLVERLREQLKRLEAELLRPVSASTTTCDVRPSLGQKIGED